MTVDFDVSQWSLEQRCTTMAKLWRRMYTAVQLTLLRDKEVTALEQLKYNFLSRHQASHFLDGLKKIGVDASEPPAIVAAKYHYLSNILGGLRMEYIEESPRKAWIRYLAPSWGYEGLALAVIPPSVQRMTYAGWHPNNAEALDAPGLVFVVTKVYQYGEPYGEGFFEELDHPVPPARRITFRTVTRSPEFDPAKAPVLDPVLWPAERVHRTRRGFARGYLSDTIMTLLEAYGVAETARIVEQALRIVAVQYGDELKAELGVTERSAAALAGFAARVAGFADEHVEVHADGPRLTVRRSTDKLFDHGDFPPAIHRAAFAFHEMVARMTNASVSARVTGLRVEGAAVDEWMFEDVGYRLF